MVCLTFPVARPDIFWVSPKHMAAAPSSLGPATRHESRRHRCGHGGSCGCLGHDIRGYGAGRSSEQCHEPGGKPSGEENILLHCTRPVLSFRSAHFGAGHQPWVPTLPKSPAHGLYLPGVCSCPKILWEWRGMGLWRGTGLQPRPTFRPCNPHLRRTRAARLPEHPLGSPRHHGTQHNLGLISSQQHPLASSRDWQQVLSKSRRDKPA